MANITVKIPRSDGSSVAESFKVDLALHTPSQLIQLIYQKGHTPPPTGGGSTIWKMGKAVGGALNECETFQDNGIGDNENLFVSVSQL